MAVLSLFVAYLGHRPLRILFLSGSLLLFGFWLNTMFSLVDLGLFYKNLLPTSYTKQLLLIFTLVTALLIGPLWCGYLCPLGALQELLNVLVSLFSTLLRRKPLISAFTCKERSRLKSLFFTALSYLRYLLLTITMLGFVLFGSQSWLDWDPLSFTFLGTYTLSPSLGLLIALLFFSLFLFRPHCRFICPVGAFISLFSLFAPLRKYFPLRSLRACDYGVRSLRDVTCIHCNRCTPVKRVRGK